LNSNATGSTDSTHAAKKNDTERHSPKNIQRSRVPEWPEFVAPSTQLKTAETAIPVNQLARSLGNSGQSAWESFGQPERSNQHRR
jgi:hypothetical protein